MGLTTGHTTVVEAVVQAWDSHSADGAIHFVCMDWRHLGEVLAAGKSAYSELKNLCVWAKTNGGMGSLYRSQHELVFVFKAGTAPHINNVELGKYGRYRTNIWSYAGINSFGKDRDAELALHPTVKPVKLVADAILDCSKRGGIVLDAFAGSGTTLIAAANTGRRGYGIELDPRYCDVIVRRMAGVPISRQSTPRPANLSPRSSASASASAPRRRQSNNSPIGNPAQPRRSHDGRQQ